MKNEYFIEIRITKEGVKFEIKGENNWVIDSYETEKNSSYFIKYKTKELMESYDTERIRFTERYYTFQDIQRMFT